MKTLYIIFFLIPLVVYGEDNKNDLLKAKPPYIDAVTGDVTLLDGIPHTQAELLKKFPPLLVPCCGDMDCKEFGWCGVALIKPGDSVLVNGDYVRLKSKGNE